MKYLALITVVFLSACVEEGSEQRSDFKFICLDSVQYWFRATGSSSLLTPRINPDTLTFVRCTGK